MYQLTKKLYPLFIVSVISSSCAVGPKYVPPCLDIPLTYKEADAGTWKVAAPQDIYDRGQWWTLFKDPLLCQLEEQATACNPTIAIASAQYDQALALVLSAKSGFFPSISGNVAYARDQSPGDSTDATTGRLNKVASYSLQSAWEVDLWGNVRSLVRAKKAAAEASAAQLAAITLSIQATLAQTYFQLRAVDEAQVMFTETIAAYEKFLSVTRNQYKAGIVSQNAVLQADADLQAIKVLAVDNQVARAQFEHAIAILTNQAPAQFDIKKSVVRVHLPQIPVEVPSTLLERRPDIAAAERRMASANAEVGVATAAFFPIVSLTGTDGYQARTFPALFSAPNLFWSLGSQLTQALFDGGARSANLKFSKAAYQEALAFYRQTVLAAFQDVEDQLSTLRILKAEHEAQTKALRAAEKQVAFAANGYKSGITSSLDVLRAQFNLFVAKRNTIALGARQRVTSVGLIKALG